MCLNVAVKEYQSAILSPYQLSPFFMAFASIGCITPYFMSVVYLLHLSLMFFSGATDFVHATLIKVNMNLPKMF